MTLTFNKTTLLTLQNDEQFTIKQIVLLIIINYWEVDHFLKLLFTSVGFDLLHRLDKSFLFSFKIDTMVLIFISYHLSQWLMNKLFCWIYSTS